MPRFVGCLIGFHSRLVVNFTGSKCGKGKLIEAFALALRLQLYASSSQKQLDRWKSVFRSCRNFGWNI